MKKLHLAILSWALAAAGVGVGYLIWAPSDSPSPESASTENETAPTDQIEEPQEQPEEPKRPGEPDTRPVGWFDGSYDRRADAALFSNSQDHVLVIACYPDKVDLRRVEMRFQYEPFPDENVGYSSTERWTFYTGTQPGLSGDFTVNITTEQADALRTAETLLYEAHPDRQPDPDAALETSLEGSRWEGENEWEQPPAVYLHRATFDLTVNREVLVAVLERCGH